MTNHDLTLWQNLSALDEKADQLRKAMPMLEDEHLKALYEALEGASVIAWQLQAEIICELQGRTRYGENTVEAIAQFLSVPARRIFELAQVQREILSRAPELRSAKLEKSHFVAALASGAKGLDPIEVLKKAADEQLTVQQMREHIKTGAVSERTPVTLHYYELVETTVAESSHITQLRYFSPSARLVEVDGKTYLEVKR